MTSDQAFIILGISNRNIDEAGLKKAFYEAARLTHPDSNPNDENAVHKFKMIKEAYALLGEYIKSDSFRDSQTEQKVNSTYRPKDKWDYYEAADKRYADERHKKAQQRAKQTMKRRAEYERMKYHESMRAESLRDEDEKINADTKIKVDAKINENLKAKRWSWLGINLPVELVGFSVLAFVAIAEMLLVAFGSVRGTLPLIMNLSAIAWWIVATQLGYYLMQFVHRQIKDKLILGLVFLLAMEGGIGLYKVLGMLLGGLNKSLSGVFMISIALICQLYNYGCVEDNLKSKDEIRRKSTIMILIEMGIALAVSVMFAILTFLH